MNISHTQQLRCYNCGIELNETNRTREHIPAQALFQGFPDSYKVDRITVPACWECNHKFSSIDEEFRNIIGNCTYVHENEVITEKAVTSILRKKNPIVLFKDGSMGVEFKESVFDEVHKKNFKGLFYYQYGNILPNRFKLVVKVAEDDWSYLTQAMIVYLKEGFEWKYSGHPDIFSYCLQPFRTNLDLEANMQRDLTPSTSDNIFVCSMKYNRTHAALVYAFDSQKQK